jgi:hypothetical protein
MVGDEAVDNLVESIAGKNDFASIYGFLKLSEKDVLGYDKKHPVKDFLLTKRPIPAWYDENRIANGQQFFRKYAIDIMTLLGAKSLPYCYAASPGNKAIYLTEKMLKVPGKRLTETAQFIIDVMRSNSFQKSGYGYIQINKTRLVHGLVRYYMNKKADWNLQWGIPVNQEDMAGTNLAFSYIILVGLEQSKYVLSDQDKEDFLYIWRYIGYQLHIDEELLPSNLSEAAALEHAIKVRNFKKSEEGVMLTAELINHYKNAFPFIPGLLVDSQIRYYLGPEISALLELKPEPFKDALMQKMNRLKEKINKVYVDPSAYDKMLRNHAVLKKKYLK